MKVFSFLFFLLLSLHLSAQDSLVCNQLPIARPDQPAKYNGDLAKAFGKLPASLKKSTTTAVFKLTIDCKGNVLKVYLQDGTLKEAEQNFFADKFITGTKWLAAVDDNGSVTSFAFVTVNIAKGKPSIVLQ